MKEEADTKIMINKMRQNLKERNVGTKRKSPKQGLIKYNTKVLTLILLRRLNPFHRSVALRVALRLESSIESSIET